jgi:hypothetical protein
MTANIFLSLVFTHDLKLKGPDRLLAIVIYLLLQKLSMNLTRPRNKTRWQPGSARVTALLMAVQGFPVNQSVAACPRNELSTKLSF